MYLLVCLEKKKQIKLDLPKNYGASQYIRRLPYIRNEDPNFKNSVIDIVNNRSDLRKFLLATPVVTDGNFNQAVALRGPDQKNKGAFELPIPLSVMFKDAKKIDIQNPIIGNLLSQVNANKISDAKVKQLLGQAKDEELQARLDRLRKRVDKSYDDDNNNNSNNINFDDSDDDDDNNVGGGKLR